MIAIVDYGAGNLTSVRKAIAHLGHECMITKDADQVSQADKLVIPGVGNFNATQPLSDGPLGVAVRDAFRSQKPVLGICLGLQWMFEGSEEAPQLPGMGTFAGRCQRFSDRVKSPHVGWNSIVVADKSRLLCGIPSGSYVYFTHSYRAPEEASTVASCNYDVRFSAAVERGNVFGVQFHPEKSGETGMRILENFCAL